MQVQQGSRRISVVDESKSTHKIEYPY